MATKSKSAPRKKDPAPKTVTRSAETTPDAEALEVAASKVVDSPNATEHKLAAQEANVVSEEILAEAAKKPSKGKKLTIAEKHPSKRTTDERLSIIEEALARNLNIDLEAVAEQVSNG